MHRSLTQSIYTGLFRNAISESGVFFYPTIADMVPQALALSEAVHCANVADPAACLMALPPATINLVRSKCPRSHVVNRIDLLPLCSCVRSWLTVR